MASSKNICAQIGKGAKATAKNHAMIIIGGGSAGRCSRFNSVRDGRGPMCYRLSRHLRIPRVATNIGIAVTAHFSFSIALTLIDGTNA